MTDHETSSIGKDFSSALGTVSCFTITELRTNTLISQRGNARFRVMFFNGSFIILKYFIMIY